MIIKHVHCATFIIMQEKNKNTQKPRFKQKPNSNTTITYIALDSDKTNYIICKCKTNRYSLHKKLQVNTVYNQFM